MNNMNTVIVACKTITDELNAGCICCQLTSDLIVTLNDIKEKINPKWVILESQ